MIAWEEAVLAALVFVCIQITHIVGTTLVWIQIRITAAHAGTHVRKGRFAHQEVVSQEQQILQVVMFREIAPFSVEQLAEPIICMGYAPVLAGFIMMITIAAVAGLRV